MQSKVLIDWKSCYCVSMFACTSLKGLLITAGIANASGVTSGKWMIFRKSSEIDDVWSTVAKACIQGELGHAVKVCPLGNSSCAICFFGRIMTKGMTS